jgi:signal transduction histidine kinase
MRKVLSWKILLAVLAIMIVVGTFFYTGYLAAKISEREKTMMAAWVTAQNTIAKATDQDDISLASSIVAEQRSIPVIETDEKDQIISWLNLDSSKITSDPEYLQEQLSQFKKSGNLITTFFGTDATRFNKYYFGESALLQQIRYFPLVQLLIVLLFTMMMLRYIHSRNRSEQDRLWAGLAKETAHQLGTPVSALEGWTALLKEGADKTDISTEMEKDINRLKIITERFSMIGGELKKDTIDILPLVKSVSDYMRKRAPENIVMNIVNAGDASLSIPGSAPLLEWVFENLLKNALDAMDEKGRIDIHIGQDESQVWIDVRDDGKGIPSAIEHEIFNPGVSTKKRGWGLGLTLSRRIVEEYHGGKLFVKETQLGNGTTFRVILKK